ncbi:hypothetical protein HRR83_006567 [Exophiala dermatitidis]|uniref:Uncharacterized protein n=1 Tax=Exophiala dermatitidis TaxID=5970 RepID=A0AAN6ERH9_EXODE|nr:hypothetical protein HRR74_005727 [Exophiala dermatitidis]KAJ4515448.1 hypothetical protein HRR73_005280 [Exophiala dermatitidis]KAJ4536495.1 hypothetical protein HRR77_007411 [Exophiala dermatitidis]KAJ4540977.1 hypothetical protein HRR76_004359 [Exophiala dermatitidis]KAJ4554800.1 hypothetical protein HRR79_009375 [Exophiala dermatitidis]
MEACQGNGPDAKSQHYDVTTTLAVTCWQLEHHTRSHGVSLDPRLFFQCCAFTFGKSDERGVKGVVFLSGDTSLRSLGSWTKLSLRGSTCGEPVHAGRFIYPTLQAHSGS